MTQNGPSIPAPAHSAPGPLAAHRAGSTDPAQVFSLTRAAATALAYVLLGALSSTLSEPPAYVCPVFAAAGLALAAVLSWGRSALVGVAAGALLLCLGAQAMGLPLVASSVPLTLLISLGATLQAALGAMLVRRFVTQPLSLTRPRDIICAAALGGLLACTASASLGTLAQWLSGSVPVANLWDIWLTWWLADTTGVVLITPAVLAFIGQPAADWRARRRTVAVPLLLSFVLLMVSALAFEQLRAQRTAAWFERDVDRLTAAANLRLRAPVLALRALQGAAVPVEALHTGWMAQATHWWLSQPYGVRAMGIALQAPESPLQGAGPGNDESLTPQVSGAEGLRVRQVQNSLAAASPTAAYPLLGFNLLSLPSVAAAVQAARANGQPSASIGFAPSGTAATETVIGVFQALYDGAPADAAARARRFRGVVFASVSAQQALAGLQQGELSYLNWCLLEADPSPAQAQRRRLAGPGACEQNFQWPQGGSAEHPSLVVKQRRLNIADQPLLLVVWAAPEQIPGAHSRSRWVVPVVGLASALLLYTLLMTITGHSRRTEQAVMERTAELRFEVAERALAQEALRASEERLRVIVDNLPLGIALLDANGHIVESNPRLCGMLGQSSEYLRGQSVITCFEPHEAPHLHALRRALVQQRRTVDSVDSMKLRAANGRLTDVRVLASALLDSTGTMAHMVAVVEDMTAHHQLQDSEQALSRAESASRAKSEFVSRMSHELRTPLNAMIGFAQLLALNEQPVLSPRQLSWAQQIQRAGWHLLAMINDTLDLARIESGATRLSLESVQLLPLLQACQDWVQASATQRHVSLQLSAAANLPSAWADATRLKQILTNLLSNAVKYNQEGGAVQVNAHAIDGEQLEVHVTDTGMGMSAEQMASLFQAYNRLGRENSSIEGTGIGLVISRRLAELMGGTLKAQSIPGQGSTFTLRLPVSLAPPSALPAPAQFASARYQQRLVHYVEDNATNVEVMRGVLAQRPQITLQTSTLGLDGLSAIRHSRPDLILLDMQLPDISGLELLRHILKDDHIANIPVIVVSADATPLNKERALTLGAKHYVTKPLDLAAFLAMVDQTLAGNPVHG